LSKIQFCPLKTLQNSILLKPKLNFEVFLCSKNKFCFFAVLWSSRYIQVGGKNMYIIINRNCDEEQRGVTVQNKLNGQLLTYYESEIEHISDKQLQDFLQKEIRV